MVTSSEKQEAMEGVFHALWHLSSSSPTDALEDLTNQLSGMPKSPKPRSSTMIMQMLISMSERLGEFDAVLGVGNKSLPLVHALVEKKDIPIAWMNVFKKTHEKFQLFETVQGKSIGARFFDRMMKGSSLYEDRFKWWLENAPALEKAEASEWVEKLTSYNKKDSHYSSSSCNKVEDLLKLLLDRGANNEARNGTRPQERWSNSKIWWEAISAEGRMKDMVRGASGRLRPMEEALALNNLTPQFAQWVSGNTGLSRLQAPHGRGKELVNNWILSHGEITIEERVKRLMLSIDASDRVMPEIWAKANSTNAKDTISRDLLREILLFRASSGLSLRGMFALRFEDKHSWLPIDVPLLANSSSDLFVHADGSGLLLQEARQSVLSAIAEPNEYRPIAGLKNFSARSQNWKRSLMGDETSHQELVDLLVDGMVSRKPYHHFVSIAKFIVEQDLLVDQILDDKLKQALALQTLSQHFNTLHNMQSNEGSSRRPPGRDWLFDAADRLEPVVLALSSGNWQLTISDKDWDTLSEGWGVTKSLISYAAGRFASFVTTMDTDIRSLGQRLEIHETTVDLPAPRSPRSRL